MDARLVSEKEILRDFFFCLSDPGDTGPLARSVAASGVLNPVWAVRAEGGLRLVAGFRRLEAARAAGLDALPCCVLPEDVPLDRHFEAALLEQASVRELHLAGKARALRVASSLGADLRGRFVAALGLPDTDRALADTLALLEFHPALLAVLESRPLTLRTAAVFRPFSPAEQAALGRAAAALGVAGVELAETAEALLDVARREGRPADAVLAEPVFRSVLEGEAANRNLKNRAFKAALHARRNPETTAVNRDLAEAIRGLDAPRGLSVRWDPSLESGGLRVEAAVRDPGDLEALSRFWGNPGNRERLAAALRKV